MEPEQQIRAAIDRFAAAWNAHDAEAMSSFWLEDGNLIHPRGHFAAGRAAVRDLLQSEHAAEMAESRFQVVRVDIREQDERRAIVEIDGRLEDVRAPHGRHYVLEHQLTAVFARTEDDWRVRTLQPTITYRAGK